MKLFTLVADLALDTAGFVTQVSNAKAEGRSLADAIGLDAESIKTSFSNAFSFAAGDLLADAVREGLRAIGEFSGESIEAASSMVEVKNVIDTLFGEDSNVIYRWAQNAKEAFGMSERDALEYVSKMAPVLDSLGFSAEESMMMAMDYIARSGDIASFRNMTFEQTFMKMMSGLRGETEAIEDLGVTVHVSSMVDWLGLEKETDFTKGMTQQEQWAARYKYIMEKTTSASGDFVKTQDTYANQMRQLDSNIEQLKVHIGEGLLPIMTELVTWFNSFFSSGEQAQQTTEDFSTGLKSSFADATLAAESALSLVSALDELSSASGDAAGSDMWNAILAELQTVLPGIGSLIDSTTGQITGGTEALREYIAEWQTSAYELARTSAIQSYYDEYANMQRSLYDLQIENAINQQMIGGMTGNIDKALVALMESAIIPYISAEYRSQDNYDYLRSDEGLQELYDALSSNDLDAIISGTGFSLSSMLDVADAWQQVADMQILIGQYEKQLAELPTYETEIALAQDQIKAYEQRLSVLENIVATQEPPTVVVNVTTTLDGDEIAASVESKIATDANTKALTAGQ